MKEENLNLNSKSNANSPTNLNNINNFKDINNKNILTFRGHTSKLNRYFSKSDQLKKSQSTNYVKELFKGTKFV